MKKFDTFKTLTQGVKSFVAMLLVTVMAVGSVIAQTTVTTTFSQSGYENAQAITTVVMDQNITLTFGQGTNANNAPKYYNTGTAIRLYPGNFMTVVPAQGVTITDVTLTFGSGDGTNALTYTVDGNSSTTLSGISATNNVTVTEEGSSGHRRVAGVTVTYTTSSTPVTVATPVITPATGTYMVAQNVAITCETAGANIYYTIDGSTPDANSTLYTAPIAVGTTTTVKAIAISGTDASSVATSTLTFPTIVANVAAFKTQTSTTELFSINSDLTVIYQSADKKATYVQDATGALYIYGTTKEYQAGDVISGGIFGKYSLYNGLTELVPQNYNEWPAGVAGTAVEPVVATLAQIQADYDAYESKLVKVENVTFTEAKQFTTTAIQNAAISQGDVTSGFQVRNAFKTLSTSVAANDVATVTGLVIKYNTTIQILPRSNDDLEFQVGPATLPLNATFESGDPGSRGWVLDNGTATNKWYIGQAAGFDNSKLFVSNNGSTNKYDINSSSTAIAYRDVVIPAAGAILTFDYRVLGEGNYDYLKVDLVQGTTTTNVGKFSGSNDWATCNFSVPASMAGNARLQFTWVNDGNGGQQFPAAVDNINLIETPCVQPTDLAASVTGANATITWTPGATTQTAWTFQYKLHNHSDWYTVNATTPTVNLTGLQGNSNYDMRVQANCGSDASDWTTGTFVVDCQNPEVTVAPTDNMIGSGTTTDGYLPFYGTYNYAYTQQIIDSADINAPADTIFSISFNCVSAPTKTGTTGNIKIWLANTTKETFASNTDYVDPTTLTQVVEVPGTYEFTTGWNTFTFNTPFVYTGGNLLVAYYEGVGDWTGITFYVHSTTGTKAIYHYNDTESNVTYTDPVNNTGTKGTKSVVNNLKLNMNIPTVNCLDVISCVAPDSLEISNVTASGADLSWVAGAANQTAFIVEYKKVDETTWTAQNVTGTSYTLTGLDQFSDYMVKVKANCGENDHSTNIEGTFTTSGNCPNITNLEYSNVSNSTTLTWNAGGSETEWLVQFKPTSAGDNEWVSINVTAVSMTTFGGLIGNTDYEARVKALCGTDSSQWVTVNFTSGCAPYSVPFEETFGAYSMPTCWTGEDFSFNSGYSRATVADAYMITPPINIPSAGTTYLTFDVEAGGTYTVLASYRGTRADRFAEIYSGQAGSRETVIIPLTDLYKGKATNFKIINGNGTQTFYNVKVNQCPFEPSNLNVSNVTENSLDLNWDADPQATNFEVQYGAKDFVLGTGTTLTATTNTVNITGLTYNEQYDFYVRTQCSDENSSWVGPFTAKVEVAIIMGAQATATTCMGVLYDNGGADGPYENNSNDVITIYPATPNSLIRLQGNYTMESPTYDNLTIYDGTSTSATQLTQVGNSGTLDITASNAAGALTLVFHSDGSSTYAGFALNISCVPAPTCGEPQNITLNAVNSTLMWNRSAWGTPTGYNVRYGLANESTYQEATVTDTFIVLNNLIMNTDYTFSVQSVCGSNETSDWVTVNLTTPCIVSLPYTNDFETFTNQSAAPDCWTKIGSGTIMMNNSTTYAHSGSYAMKFSGALSNTVALPVFTASNVLLTFYTRPESYTNSSCGEFDLGLVDAANNFTTLETYVYSDFSSNVQKSREIQIPAGSRIAMRHRPTSTSWYWFVDDVNVSEVPTCGVPTVALNGTVITITPNSTYGTAQSYDIKIGDVIKNVTTTTVDLQPLFNLASSTNYSVSVRSNCGGTDVSVWTNAETFVTPCVAMTLPYYDDFDNYAGSTTTAQQVMPNCWERKFTGTSTSYNAGVYNNSLYSTSGINTLRLYNYYTTNTTSTAYGDLYAVLPEMNASLNTLMLSFNANTYNTTSTSYFCRFDVGVVTDPVNPETSFTPYQHINLTSGSNQQLNIAFDNYTGTAGRIAFRMLENDIPDGYTAASGYNYLYIDNLSVTAISTCNIPSLTVKGNTATITPNTNGGTPASYELRIGTDTYTTTSTTVNLAQAFPNLQYSTTYEVDVRANCGNNSMSDWSVPVPFTMPCAPMSLPYFQNFDSYTSSTSQSTMIMADCWDRTFTGTATTSYGWGIYTSSSTVYATSDISCLRLYNYALATTATPSPAYGDAYAVMPQFTGNINDLAISFNLRSQNTTNTNYMCSFDVGVVTDGGNPEASFTSVQHVSIPNSSRDHISISFANYSGPAGRIAFRMLNSDRPSGITTYVYNYGYIDDIVVSAGPCYVPSINVVGSDATITPAAGTPSGYELQIGNETQTTTSTTVDLMQLFPSLQQLSDYQVRVRAICGTDYSDWSEYVDFTTPCAVKQVPFFEDFDSYTGTTSFSTQVIPDCWNRTFTGTSTAYGWGIYAGTASTNPFQGTNSLRLYNYNVTASSSTSLTYGSAYVVLPKLNTPINQLMISLDAARQVSTTTYGSYFEVGVVTNPYDPDATFTPITGIVSVPTGGTHYDLPLSAATVTNGYIALHAPKWTSPRTTGTYNYVYIDNLSVTVIPTCMRPTLEVNAGVATITPQTPGTPVSFELQIGNTVETVPATTTTVDLITLFALDLSTPYSVRARMNCTGNDNSEWTDWVDFNTPACVGGASVEFDGTSNNSYIPTYTYYDYSYSQQIYLSSEINAPNGGQIKSLAFQVNTPQSTNPRDLKIYLSHTNVTNFPNSTANGLSDQSWLPIANAQLVYTGTYTFAQAGWNEIIFDTPFNYNGTDNLAIIVDDNTGDDPNSVSFKVHTTYSTGTTTTYRTIRKYQMTTDIDPTNLSGITPVAQTTRSNVKFDICPPVTCYEPENVTVSNLHDSSAVVTWAANSNNAATATYVLEYRSENDAAWTVVPVSGFTYSLTGLTPSTNYVVRVKTDCGGGDESTYAKANFTTLCPHGYYDENGLKVICPDANDLAILNMSNFKDACEIDGPVTITVKNLGYEPVTTFTAFYTLNDGTPVAETVTPSTPLALQDEYIYMFTTQPVFVNGSNSVKTWATIATMGTETLTSNVFMLNPETVPYVEDFTSVQVNHGWNAIDVNNDGVTMNVNWGEVVYTYNDQAAANDWIMSPCVEILTPGTYTVAYDYAAESVLPESFEVFYGNGAHIADMTNALATHSFSGTTVNHAKYNVNITTPGVYNFGFHATSPAGAMGFSIDNFSVKPVINVTVTSSVNGTVSPSGVVQVPYEENLTLTIVPAPMYHVYGVWVDGTQVVPEDANGANLMLYTLENVTAEHTIYVDYKLTFHIIKQAVNYNPTLYPNVDGGYFIPAATDTLLDNSPFTVYFAADNHYHFNKLELGVMTPNDLTNVTTDVVPVGNGVYSYTLDTLRVANYYTIATFRKDTVNIHYNILTGKGYVDASDELTAPTQYDTWIDYEAGHTSNIVPANGYYLVDVDGNGPVNTLTFNNVTTQQDVNVKFGFNVTAEVNNYYATNLGSNEIRGTIAPTTALVAEGESHTITGTVQNHFHLESFLIDGVENIQDVTINNDGTFSYTFAEVHGNYHVNAIVKIDTFCITYNVAGGLAIIDNEATTTDPATRKICFNYFDSWMSSFAPVAGYEITEINVDGVNYGFHDDYLFENISTNHVVNITIVPKTIVIDVNGYGNGTVSNDTVVSYDPSFVYHFTAIPAVGHHIVSIMRNNVNIPVANPEAGYAENLVNITESQNIVVYFAANEYVVTATTHNGGIITPAGATTYTYGSMPVYTITPNAGYHISNVKVNGVSVGAVTTYTFPAITADQTIEAEFAANIYTVTVNPVTNGTITGPAASYSYGATPTYTITPATGYYIVDVTVDGQSVGAVSTYTFAPIAGNHTIGATFAQLTYTINAIAGNGGAVTPAGATVVNYGANQTYAIAAATGYHIDEVFVDGVSVGAVTSYVFSNVTADHTISATFAANTFTVTVNQPQHGTIAPGTQTVVYGATPTFTITPNVGYTVGAITLNGANVMGSAIQVGNAYSYTLPAVTANATLTATMNAITYTIVASAGSNGNISPSGTATVNHGANATYTITPNAGYEIDKVLVDGINMGAVGTYTFVNVVHNHTINATFKQSVCDVPSNLYTINIDTTSATFTWYHAGAQSYDVRYKAQGSTGAFTEANVTTNLYNATGLQPNTTYVWQVRAHCAANLTSEWSNAMVFRTKAVPEIDHTGVENHVSDLVRVYASQNNVYITNDNGVRIDNVTIYDVYGKMIYTGKVNSNTEVISLNVATGTYMVRLSTENGMANYKVFITK